MMPLWETSLGSQDLDSIPQSDLELFIWAARSSEQVLQTSSNTCPAQADRWCTNPFLTWSHCPLFFFLLQLVCLFIYLCIYLFKAFTLWILIIRFFSLEKKIKKERWEIKRYRVEFDDMKLPIIQNICGFSMECQVLPSCWRVYSVMEKTHENTQIIIKLRIKSHGGRIERANNSS